MSSPSDLLSDIVRSPPPARLLYWLLQYCSFDGLLASRSELRSLLEDASERDLQADVDRAMAARLSSGGGSGGGGRGGRGRGSRKGRSSDAERSAIYNQLSAERDAAMAAADAEVRLRVRLRQLYASIVECSYERAMGLSVWLTELRDEWDEAGLPFSSHSSLFRLQLVAIGNTAIRAADRPRTSKADFDMLMRHLMQHAAVTEGEGEGDGNNTTRHSTTQHNTAQPCSLDHNGRLVSWMLAAG